jgi:ketol-acid reductoisomerase
VREDGLQATIPPKRRPGRDVVMMLAPTSTTPPSTATSSPRTCARHRDRLSHGLAIRFGLIEPRADLDVFLVAPKGPARPCASSTPKGAA